MLILQGLGLMVTVTFISYVVAIVIPYLRHRPLSPGVAESFDWHVLIPCRDEASVIATTVERLRAHFPFASVWVIDDGSDDATGQIAGDASIRDDRVHLVERKRPQARTGKGAALNAGYRALRAYLPPEADHSRTIVTVVDADGSLSLDAFDRCAGEQGFAVAGVGAVQVGVHMVNRDDPRPRADRGWVGNSFARLLVRMQDLEFRATIAAMQFLRVGCKSVGLGGNGQFTRLSMLDDIAEREGTPWHGALLEDYELGVHALLAGWQIRYVHDAYVEQEGLSSLRRLIVQRTRWSQGNMQCVRYLPRILSSPKMTGRGALEAGYFLVLPFVQVLGALIWPALFGYMVFQAASDPSGVTGWIEQYWLLSLFTFTLGVLPFVLWGPIYRRKCEPDSGLLRSIGWGFTYWLYVYYMYACNLWGFYRLVTGNSGWVKTRRNSELRHAHAIRPHAHAIRAKA
jgi:1,2-diacylglycerol 3-beta-glucosyltransferase